MAENVNGGFCLTEVHIVEKVNVLADSLHCNSRFLLELKIWKSYMVSLPEVGHFENYCLPHLKECSLTPVYKAQQNMMELKMDVFSSLVYLPTYAFDSTPYCSFMVEKLKLTLINSF